MRLVFTGYVSAPEFDDPYYWLKRIEGYTGILEALSKNHQVVGIERINYEGRLEQNGVLYEFIRLKKKTTKFPFRLHRLIKKLHPDIVFINGFNFPLQIIQLALAMGRRPKIFILHRAERPFKGWKKWIQKLADQYVDAYLFTSAAFKEQWKENLSVSKIHEVIQASSRFTITDKTIARNLLGISGRPVFLWVGALIARKDPITVVRAFLEFVRDQSGAKLYMIYQSDELLNEVQSLLEKEKQLAEAVVLAGKIPHHDLGNWYNSADFIITGSHYEGSGVAIAEAMSCGCIPITTDFLSFRKMLGPGKCGLMYETGNQKALLGVLKRIPELDLEKERERVLKQFREELSFEAIAEKINRIIASI